MMAKKQKEHDEVAPPTEAPAKKKVVSMTAADTHLLPETAAHIRTKDWVGGHKQVFGSFGTIDLTTLTLGRARSLIRQGFKKLTEI